MVRILGNEARLCGVYRPAMNAGISISRVGWMQAQTKIESKKNLARYGYSILH